MKYLVTGGAGFIGSALVRRLVSEGHDVRVLDDCSRGSAERLAGLESKIQIIDGDIRNSRTVVEAAEGVDSVCHLAFVNGTEFFYQKPRLVMDVGIRGMLSVLDACEIHGIQELVLASSSEVYQTPPVIPTPENAPFSIPDPWNPRYSYASSKAISELMAINYGRGMIDRLIIFRPHNVYGPQMGFEHVIPQFVLRMLELKKTGLKIEFPIQGDGSETRAFCYIDDFIDGLIIGMKKLTGHEIIHIGTDEEVSIRRVAELTAETLGVQLQIQPGPPAEGGTKRRCPDISKLVKLGYKPKTSLEEGIRRTAEWYASNSLNAAKRG